MYGVSKRICAVCHPGRYPQAASRPPPHEPLNSVAGGTISPAVHGGGSVSHGEVGYTHVQAPESKADPKLILVFPLATGALDMRFGGTCRFHLQCMAPTATSSAGQGKLLRLPCSPGKRYKESHEGSCFLPLLALIRPARDNRWLQF